jgi:hypothetical protein
MYHRASVTFRRPSVITRYVMYSVTYRQRREKKKLGLVEVKLSEFSQNQPQLQLASGRRCRPQVVWKVSRQDSRIVSVVVWGYLFTRCRMHKTV